MDLSVVAGLSFKMVTDSFISPLTPSCFFCHQAVLVSSYLLNSSVWKSLWIMLTLSKRKVPTHYAEIRSDTPAALRLSQNLLPWDFFFHLWCFMHLDGRLFHELLLRDSSERKEKVAATVLKVLHHYSMKHAFLFDDFFFLESRLMFWRRVPQRRAVQAWCGCPQG